MLDLNGQWYIWPIRQYVLSRDTGVSERQGMELGNISCRTRIACKADCTQECHLFLSTKHPLLPSL